MAGNKTIRIMCETKDSLPLGRLEVFQGDLKKRNGEDYRRIGESIIKHGFAAPFFVWRDGGYYWLLDGTGRKEALERLQALGWEVPDLPVVYVRAESEAAARELLLKITSRFGKVSAKGLEEFLKGLEIDFDGLDLGVFIKRDLKTGLGIVPQAAKEPKTLPGDLYEFIDGSGAARHRLLCGDACDEKAFARLMGGELAAMAFTDPPYGVSLGERNKDVHAAANKRNARIDMGHDDRLAGDDLKPEELRRMLAAAFANMSRHMRDDAAFYACGGSNPEMVQAQLAALAGAGLRSRHMIIWCKNAAGFSMNRNDYAYQHEVIWYGWKERRHFYGRGKFKTTLWNFSRPRKSPLHPTMKPPELIEEAIKNSMEPAEKRACGIENNTGRDGIVLDPFAGSGSALAACESLKRRAFMIELEPKYCDVIALRALGINPGLAVWRERGGKRERLEAKDLGG